MKKRYFLLIIILFVLITIILRYPNTFHEKIADDSYFIHFLSLSIIDHQRIIWIMNPLSYFGLYPVSYPVGTPILLASFFSIVDTNRVNYEYLILIQDFLLGIFSFSSMFILIKKVFPKYFSLQILISFIYITSPKIIELSSWGLSARSIILILSPILYFLLLNIWERNHINKKYLCVFILLFFSFFLIHRSSILFIGVIIIFILTQIIFYKDFKLTQIYIILFFGIGLFILLFSYNPIGNKFSFISIFETGGFLTINNPIINSIITMMTSYLGRIGILILLLPFGIYYLANHHYTNKLIIFILVIIIFFIPFLSVPNYIILILLPILIIIIGYGCIHLLHKMFKSKFIKITLIILLLLISSSFTSWILDYRNNLEYGNSQLTVNIDEEIFQISNELIYNYHNESFIINDQPRSALIVTLSYSKTLYVGTTFGSIYGLMNGYNNVSHIQAAPTERDFPYSLYFFFENVKFASERDYWLLMRSNVEFNNSKHIIKKYDLKILIENNDEPGSIVTNQKYPYEISSFFESSSEKFYKTYSDKKFSIKIIGENI